MLADEFIIGAKVNGSPSPTGVPPIGACDPNAGFFVNVNPVTGQGFTFNIPYSVHGFFIGAPNNRRSGSVFAAKIRWRLNAVRRSCVSSCVHTNTNTAPGCGGGIGTCDGGMGNLTQTLMPPNSIHTVLPEQFNFVDRAWVGAAHDFSWSQPLFDSEPPASPFCGVP